MGNCWRRSLMRRVCAVAVLVVLYGAGGFAAFRPRNVASAGTRRHHLSARRARRRLVTSTERCERCCQRGALRMNAAGKEPTSRADPRVVMNRPSVISRVWRWWLAAAFGFFLWAYVLGDSMFYALGVTAIASGLIGVWTAAMAAAEAASVIAAPAAVISTFVSAMAFAVAATLYAVKGGVDWMIRHNICIGVAITTVKRFAVDLKPHPSRYACTVGG